MTTYLLNQELNGVEIYFKGKPATEILTELKENGFRWNRNKLCWYAKQSEKTITTAQTIANGNITEATPQQPKTKATKKVLSLYERLQFKEGNTDTSKYHYKFVGSNYTGLSTKETASEVRKHLRKQFPEVKFSVTSDYNKINITIKESPYCNIEPEHNEEITNYRRREEKQELNKELYSIIEYCKSLLNSYNYDDSDSMTDYFNTHFYTNVSIDYDYKQLEQTEEVKNDITEFRNRLLEDAKAEEERKEKEYQKYLTEQEEKEKAYKIRLEEEKKEIEYINNNVEVKELTEQDQYFVIGSQFAHLNKNNRLETYIEEVKNGEFSLENVKITREIHLDNKAYEYFKNHLLTDFDFIKGTGGSYTDDNRINSMLDYDNMTPEERKTVKFNLLGLAVYVENELKIVIDTQGFGYARYVGLVKNPTITKDFTWDQVLEGEELEALKETAEEVTDISFNVITDNNIVDTWQNENWKLYKDKFKEELKENVIRLNKEIVQQIPEGQETLKYSLYKMLKETDKVQDQFTDADLKQGQQMTIFKTSMLGGISTSHITVDSVEYKDYAQYKDNVKLTFSQKGKRGLYSTNLHDDVLIYNGWVSIPETLLYDTGTGNGFSYTRTKFGSYDKEQYNLIIDYLQEKEITPIINTIKPIF